MIESINKPIITVQTKLITKTTVQNFHKLLLKISLVNTVYSEVQMWERKRLERALSSTDPLSKTIGHVVCLSFSRCNTKDVHIFHFVYCYRLTSKLFSAISYNGHEQKSHLFFKFRITVFTAFDWIEVLKKVRYIN